MKVYFVGAGPGDPDLLTVKAKRLLETCRVCVYAGSLVSDSVLALLPAGAKKVDSSKISLDEIVQTFKEALYDGEDVVRLHSGDPSIYGAIREQMNDLDVLGIEYEVVPGVSSFQAAAAALKTELTAPEISQAIILTRTPGRTPVPSGQELKHLANSLSTLCIFLSTQKIRQIVADLIPLYGHDCPAAVVYHASWPDEKIFRGNLSDIAEKIEQSDITKTAMVIVGKALSRDIPASKLYAPGFSHGFRQGSST
jgi:precorrin-4/cobalt-precorrin-4 C11-methyltransferase